MSEEKPTEFDTSYYEPKSTYSKRNSIATTQTFQLITPAIVQDNLAHQFYAGVPMVVDRIFIQASGVITVGPQGNPNFPLNANTQIQFTKIDINQIWYANASGVAPIWFMYEGCPSISTESGDIDKDT